MKSYFFSGFAQLSHSIWLFFHSLSGKNAGLKDCSAKVENSHIGMNVFGVFL